MTTFSFLPLPQRVGTAVVNGVGPSGAVVPAFGWILPPTYMMEARDAGARRVRAGALWRAWDGSGRLGLRNERASGTYNRGKRHVGYTRTHRTSNTKSNPARNHTGRGGNPPETMLITLAQLPDAVRSQPVWRQQRARQARNSRASTHARRRRTPG